MGLNNLQTGGTGGISPGGLRNLTEISAIPDSEPYQTNRWPTTEGSGTTLTDDVGNLDGAISGATWVSGVGVGDFYLDYASGDRTDLPDGSGAEDAKSALSHFVNSATGSFGCWVNTDLSSSDDSRAAIVGGDNDSGKKTFVLRRESSTEVYWRGFNGSSFIWQCDGGSINDADNWVPVVGTVDGSSAQLYIGETGTEVASDGSLGSTASGDLTTDISFGVQNADALQPWDGGIDMPWFSDQGVSQTQVQDWIDKTKEYYP